MLPALIPLAVGVLPELAKWVFGDRAEKPAAAVAEVVRAVTGTDDPAQARAAIEADPALATQLRVELARIAADAEREQRAAELETLRAHLADVQSARGQTVELARVGSGVQWSASIVSFIVLVAFAAMAMAVLFKAVPTENREAAMLMLGSLSSFAGAAITYWLGSSAGSAAKNVALLGKGEGR